VLSYRSHNGNRQVINVIEKSESTVMDIFMGYLEKVVTYAVREAQPRGNREKYTQTGLVSTNRPALGDSLREMERELAVDFLARRMAPVSSGRLGS
jgi:hypothetical protein